MYCPDFAIFGHREPKPEAKAAPQQAAQEGKDAR
jgi:hypothetical protein